MPPTTEDSLNEHFLDGGEWSDEFYSGSDDCVALKESFFDFADMGQLTYTDNMIEDAWTFVWSQGGEIVDAWIIVDNFVTGMPDTLAMKVVIHESSHANGCGGINNELVADGWAEYCIVGGGNPPPDPCDIGEQ